MATIQNDRDISLQATVPRLTSTSVVISSTAQAFVRQKNGGATSPSSITLSTTTVFVSPTYTWYYALSTAINTWISIGTNSSSLVIDTNTFEASIGTALFARFKCVVTETNYVTAENYTDILYSKQADDAITITLQSSAAVVSATTAGVVATLPPANFFKLYRAGVQLTTGVTYGTTATKNGLTATVDAAGQITFSQSSWSTDAETFTFTATYNSVTYTATYSISKAKTGTTGTDGNRSITINAFAWSNSGSAPARTQAFTYTWSTGAVSAYPSGYTASAGAAPGTGYVLYQLNMAITGSMSVDTVTGLNWSSSVVNSIGYRQDGSIGVQGDSARIAYVVSTSASAPALLSSTTTGTSSLPSSTGLTWSATATSSLSPGQFMYQSDGIYNKVTDIITWGSAYLSNLKVGSLSAISADLGIVQISTTGSLYSAGKTYGGATAGFFLGYDSTAYKFDIGNSTNYLRWSGSALDIRGNITGASSIDITGTAKFNGTFSGGGFSSVALLANDSYASMYGIIAYSNNGSLGASGVVGIAKGAFNNGLEGNAFTSGAACIAIKALAVSGNTALHSEGGVSKFVNSATTYYNSPVVFDSLSTAQFIAATTFDGTATFNNGISLAPSKTVAFSSTSNTRSKTGTSSAQVRITIDGNDYWVDYY